MRSVLSWLILFGAGTQVDAGVVAASLEVEVHARGDAGLVWILLFDRDGRDAYPTRRERAIARRDVKPVGGRARTRFEGLSPGDYAVAVVHDENGNGKLDTGLFRIPVEGLGASNDARALIGPPSFDAARIAVRGPRSGIEIHVAY